MTSGVEAVEWLKKKNRYIVTIQRSLLPFITLPVRFNEDENTSLLVTEAIITKTRKRTENASIKEQENPPTFNPATVVRHMTPRPKQRNGAM